MNPGADYTMVRLDNRRRMGLIIGKDGVLWWMNPRDKSFEEALPEDYKLKWDIPGLTKEREAELRQRIKI